MIHRILRRAFCCAALFILLFFTIRRDYTLHSHPGLTVAGLVASVAAHVGALVGISYLSSNDTCSASRVKNKPIKNQNTYPVIYVLDNPPPAKSPSPMLYVSDAVQDRIRSHIDYNDFANSTNNSTNNSYKPGSEYGHSWDVNIGPVCIEGHSWIALLQFAWDLFFGSSKMGQDQSRTEYQYSYNDYLQDEFAKYEECRKLNCKELYGRSDLSEHQLSCAPHKFHGIGYSKRSSADIIKSFCEGSKSFLGNQLVDWSSPGLSLCTLDALEYQIRESYEFRKEKIKPLEAAFEPGYVDTHIYRFRSQMKRRKILGFEDVEARKGCPETIKLVVGEEYFDANKEWFVDRIVEDFKFVNDFTSVYHDMVELDAAEARPLLNDLSEDCVGEAAYEVDNFNSDFCGKKRDFDEFGSLASEARRYAKSMCFQSEYISQIAQYAFDQDYKDVAQFISKYVCEMIGVARKALDMIRVMGGDESAYFPGMDEIFVSIKNMNTYASKAVFLAGSKGPGLALRHREIFLVRDKFLGVDRHIATDATFALRFITSGFSLQAPEGSKSVDAIIKNVMSSARCGREFVTNLQHKTGGLVKDNSLMCNIFNPFCYSFAPAISRFENSFNEFADGDDRSLFEIFDEKLQHENNEIEALRQGFKEREGEVASVEAFVNKREESSDELWQERVSAGNKVLQEGGNHSVGSYVFGERNGNALQHKAFGEASEILKTCLDSQDALCDQDYAKNSFTVAQQAAHNSLLFTQAHAYEDAFALIDFGRSALLFAQKALTAIPEGVVRGVGNFVNKMSWICNRFVGVITGQAELGPVQCIMCLSGAAKEYCPLCSGKTDCESFKKFHEIESQEMKEEQAKTLAKISAFAKKCLYEPRHALVEATAFITETALNLLVCKGSSAGVSSALEGATYSLGAIGEASLTLSSGVVAVETVAGAAAAGVMIMASGGGNTGSDTGGDKVRAIDKKIAEKKLPTEGEITFEVKKGTSKLKKETLNGRRGSVDKHGNVWSKSDVIVDKWHWDVQLSKRAPKPWWDIAKSKGKNYLNVELNGEIGH